MLKFQGCEFNAAGANKNAQVYGLSLNGVEDILIEDCIFSGKGYAGLLNKTAGDVTVKNCKFECDDFRNPIEGGQAAAQGNLTVEDCKFFGVPGNNFISFYNVKANSVHNIKNCYFEGNMADNNVVRLSNVGNATATFNIENCRQHYLEGEEGEYTGFIICQDYTKRTGKPQSFGIYTINIDNLDRPDKGQIVYVYEDGAGIIQSNYPVLNVDGERVFWVTSPAPMEEEEEF